MGSLADRRAKAGASHTSPTTATGALNRMNERPRDVRLSDITLDLGLQFRLDAKGTGGIDEKHVLDLMHVIADGADTDPVILYRVDNALLMADGFHRYEAYRRNERTTIPAIVRDGTYEDAEEAAENANLQFKKALGDESKKYIFARRVQRGYQTNGISWNNLSDKAIAAELGVGYDTIARWFNELQSGVVFATPAGQEVSIQVPIDRSVVYGRDGKRYEVESIREANSKRAEVERQRRAAEEAERKRGLPALDKMRVITQYLISKYRDSQAKKGKPLFDDPDKGFKWCFQVSNPVFVVDIDWENQFLREYGAKPVGLYREFLRLADQAIFTEADMDGWSDEELADWVTAMKQRPPRQPNAATFQQTGMAQPKNPNLEYQPPTPTGRHRTTDQPPAATETETHSEPPIECPFKPGQNVEVFKSGEKGVVHRVEYVNHEWRIHVSLYDGLHVFKADELQRIFAEVMEEAIEATPTPIHDDPAPCPFKVGDRVILKRNPKPVSVVKSVRQDKAGIWRLTMTTEDGYEFYEVPASLAFAPTEVVVEERAVVPFRTGDILKDIQTGEYVEVIGFSSDGSITVQGEDGSEYPAQAGDFEKALHITPELWAQASSKPPNGEYKPSNGTQTQMTTNYIALMNIITRFTNALHELEGFDLNIQYLQQPETLENIWQAIKSAGDLYTKVSEVVLERLTVMANTGLPYDPRLAEQTLKEGMQRA